MRRDLGATFESDFESGRLRNAQIQEVIVIVHCVGTGLADNIIREVTEYWTQEGALIARIDPHPDGSARTVKTTTFPSFRVMSEGTIRLRDPKPSADSGFPDELSHLVTQRVLLFQNRVETGEG
jgi:hypothetical protein